MDSNEPSTVHRLRSDIEVVEEPDGKYAARVVDRAFGKSIDLDTAALRILQLIDGERTENDVSAALAHDEPFVPPSVVRQALRFFDEQLLFDNDRYRSALSSGVEMHEFAVGEQQIASDPELEKELLKIHFLDDARHNCVGCGMCCRGYEFGPLHHNEAESLREMTFDEDGARLERSRKVLDIELNGQEIAVLESRPDGRCVFLAGDGKCIIHREHGAAAKPWFCQLFPTHFVRAPDGKIFGSLQMECFGYHLAARKGPYLAEKVIDVRQLFKLQPMLPVMADQVTVGPDRTLTLEEYYRVEQWILDRARYEPSLDRALYRSGQYLKHLENGGDLDDFPPDDIPALAKENEPFVRQLASFARWTIEGLSPRHASREATGLPSSTLGMRSFYLDTVDYFTGEVEEDLLAEIDAVRGPSEDPECVSILRDFVRNEVFCKEWYRTGDLRPAFALSVARYLLIVAASRRAAHEREKAYADPETTSYGMSIVHRNTRHTTLRSVLRQPDSPLVSLYRSFVDGDVGNDGTDSPAKGRDHGTV